MCNIIQSEINWTANSGCNRLIRCFNGLYFELLVFTICHYFCRGYFCYDSAVMVVRVGDLLHLLLHLVLNSPTSGPHEWTIFVKWALQDIGPIEDSLRRLVCPFASIILINYFEFWFIQFSSRLQLDEHTLFSSS